MRCTCDEVTKQLGGSLIDCPEHGQSYALNAIKRIRELEADSVKMAEAHAEYAIQKENKIRELEATNTKLREGLKAISGDLRRYGQGHPILPTFADRLDALLKEK